MSEKKPPESLRIKFCPTCGHRMPFTGMGHYVRGSRCSGKLVTVEYRRVEEA